MFASSRFSNVFFAAAVCAATLLWLPRLHSSDVFPVSGIVKDATGAAVAGATVSLFTPAGSTEKTRTAADGSFTFQRVLVGTVILEVDAPGFQRQSRRLIAGANTDPVEITLEIAGLHSEVTVVASETPELPAEVAKAVSVIPAETISRRDLVLLSDALQSIPALQVQQLGGPGRLVSFRMRGLRPEDTTVLLDGFPLRDASENKGALRPFLSDLLVAGAERVEVLRGAGSTLYGTSAIGGAINIVSSQPSAPFSGWISTEGGSLGLFQGSGGFGGILSRQRLNYALNATHINYTDGLDDHDAYRNSGGTAKAVFHPTASTEISARFALTDSFAFLNRDPEPAPNLPPLPSGVFVRDAIAYPKAGATFIPQTDDPDSRQAQRLYSGAARFDYQPMNAWSQSLSYEAVRGARRYDNGPLGNTVAPGRSRYDSTLDGVAWRNALQLGRSDTLHFSLGWERTSIDQEEFGVGTRAAQHSLLVQLQNLGRLLGDRLQLQAALQAEYYRLDAPRFRGAGANPYSGVAGVDVPSTYSGDGAASYYVARTGTKVRVHAGNGYRSASLYERFGSSGEGFYFGYPLLKPELTTFVEGGIDQLAATGKARFSATYFYTHFQRRIDFVPTPDDRFGRLFGYMNVSGGNARGVELSTGARPSRLFEFEASYTYTNSDQVSPTSAGNTRFLGLSDHQFTLGVNLQPQRRVNLHLQTYAVSSHDFPLFGTTFPFDSETYRFPGFVREDLTVSWTVRDFERGRLRVLTRIDNLFNREYYQAGFLAPKASVRGGLRWEF